MQVKIPLPKKSIQITCPLHPRADSSVPLSSKALSSPRSPPNTAAVIDHYSAQQQNRLPPKKYTIFLHQTA
jgi:hypothetical protein